MALKVDPQTQLLLAEKFVSIQGEGVLVGTPMTFIRLAGCTVGEFTPPVKLTTLSPESEKLKILRIQNPRHSICTTALGEQFLCDTDYFKKETLSIEAILKYCDSTEWVCITGGEPFMHTKLDQLIKALINEGHRVQIETSGTIHIQASCPFIEFRRAAHQGESGTPRLHVTCSPKKGYLKENEPYVREFKFVVDGRKPIPDDEIQELIGSTPVPVYLQPINSIDKLDVEQVVLLMDKLHKCNHRDYRLSLQLHKVLGVS